MIAELGHFALVLAFVVALLQAVLPLVGVHRGNLALQRMARTLAPVQFLCLLLSFLGLTWAFIHNDFTLDYVSRQSNTQLPIQYKISAVWGGHEGSLLLWVTVLSAWGAAVALFGRGLPREMIARVLAIMGMVNVAMMAFVLMTSNPFRRLLPDFPMNGADLNPLLQDPGLIVHPPLLYMGYVGFTVPFAFAMAGLLGGRLDSAWARWSRPWAIAAWGFLTLGIALGSWWAYYELGWGGWWFWDPVENASLMPWLFGTALIHALMVTDKRGGFKAWSVLLAIGAFSLSLLGTFLVRSGVLTSVHAFAADPRRGVFILIFLALVVGISLTLFAWRAPKATLGGKIGLVSRESMLLTNSVLLVVATGAVLLGTIYPLIVDALNLGKLSVGAPYFNAVFVPLMVPVVFLMVPGGIAHWREARWKTLGLAMRIPALAAVLVAAFIWGFTEKGNWLSAMGMALATWVFVGLILQIVDRVKKPGRIPPSFWGMHLAHLGIAVVVVGVTLVKGYEVERDVRMGLNDTVRIENYNFELVSVSNVDGPNYKALRGEIKVTKDNQFLEVLHPEKRKYFSSAMPMTEAAIDSGLFRDLYVSLGESIAGDKPQWSVRVFYKPFVSWLWYGAILMVLGGLLAVSDRRYRKSADSLS
ncbi:MAG: heme lyase CcmF/NrfE family subunit [Rhodoferax sp.]